jgi:hypothetical protein
MRWPRSRPCRTSTSRRTRPPPTSRLRRDLRSLGVRSLQRRGSTRRCDLAQRGALPLAPPRLLSCNDGRSVSPTHLGQEGCLLRGWGRRRGQGRRRYCRIGRRDRRQVRCPRGLALVQLVSAALLSSPHTRHTHGQRSHFPPLLGRVPSLLQRPRPRRPPPQISQVWRTWTHHRLRTRRQVHPRRPRRPRRQPT